MRTFVFGVILALFGFIAGCATPAETAPRGTTGAPAVSAAEVPAPPPISEYRLGSGDRLRVIVFNNENLSGEFQLDGQGFVSLPLIGNVNAKDMTVREFERIVEGRLKDGYLNDPKVSAQVLNFRPFYILGEVNRPDTYPFTDGLTVLNAVATAGGFTYRADQRRVYLKRAGETTERLVTMDPALPVGPGDTIRIPERFF